MSKRKKKDCLHIWTMSTADLSRKMSAHILTKSIVSDKKKTFFDSSEEKEQKTKRNTR